ncbi:MAG TPA: hypothetical protein IAB70_01360, partial [Candidatus Merdicola faecigallinarum]|nr:hypothetical protein [Candidatus Merdicola faecigallinarum]
SKVKQGETIEEVQVTYSLKEFVTLKMPAEVQIKNLFVTGDLIDFDVRIEDLDHAVLTNKVRIELRDEKTNLILLEEINTNEEYTRKTIEKLETGKTYTLSFYADQYNEGNTDETYEANYLLKQLNIVTETGITGSIGLTDLTRKGTGKNLVDVESEIKWFTPMFNVFYQAYYERTYQKETGILTLAGGNIYAADQQYFYNLKDYVGQKVTISFKVRKKKDSGELIFAFKEGRYSSLQEIPIQEEEWSTFSKTVLVSSDGYVGFLVRRNSEVGDNKIPRVEMKELQIELGENQTTYEPYQYELEANLLINLEDKKGEIPNGTYYIRKYENDQFVEEKAYSDMDENNQVMNKMESHLVAENVTYRFELIVKINEREYILDSQEFESKPGKEIKGIRTEEDFLQMQPKGNYILLNNLEIICSGLSHRFGSEQIPFNGEFDGNGYSITRSSSGSNSGNSPIFYVIGAEGKVHDIVWNIQMNNTVEYDNFYGVFEKNYGRIENIILKLIESTELSNIDVYLLGEQNRGLVNNFAIHLQEPLYGARGLSAAVRDNYGTLKNGYIYGEEIKATFPMLETENKEAGGLCVWNYGTIQNVYGLINIELNEESREKETANLVYLNQSAGSVENVYSIGIGNTMNTDKGPTISSNSGLTNNVYYFADTIFSNTYNWKTTMLALQDKVFQSQLLNGEGAFEVEELLERNYFPQLRLPSNMPKQDYIPLPEVEDGDLADILSIAVLEQGTNRLTARVSVNNPSGETITDIKVKDLTCNIISQEYKDGKSSVEIELTNPIKYVSSYSVLSITTKGAYNIPYTRKFEEGERRIEVSLFREVYTISDWKEINHSPTENYQLMNDLNFINETKGFNISKAFTGILNGAGHKIYNIRIDSTLNQGMFVEVRGEIRDLFVENFSIKGVSYERMAFVSYLNKGVIDGVYLKDVTIEINENLTSNQYIGGIVSYTGSGIIRNSSITNLKVKSNAEVSNTSVGGILSRGSSVDISNCYAKDIHIEVEQSIASDGMGGIAGKLDGNTKVSYCYATGNIMTSNSMVGGIAGYITAGTSVIQNNYSFVNIQSAMEYLGGIVGIGAEKGQVTYNLALGNVYTSKSKAEYIGRVAGDSNSLQNAYAYENQLINGSNPVEEGNIYLLSKEKLLQEVTYTEKLRFEQNFDYSQLQEAILPKLKNNENTKILPNQSDLKLEEHPEFQVQNIEYEKTDAYKLTVRIELKNAKEYPITNVVIENMNTKLMKQTHSNGISFIELEAIPTKYYDSYKISEIQYQTATQIETKEIESKLETIFYKEIYSYEDWQSIDPESYENYRLMNDLDFSGKSDMKVGISVNRFISDGSKLKNINLEMNQKNASIILELKSEMTNIGFENIHITNTGGDGTGIIYNNSGTISNLKLENIELEAENKSYVAPICKSTLGQIEQVEMNRITVKGKDYVAGLIGMQQQNVMQNVTANEVIIEGTGNYVGGINGRKYENTHTFQNISIQNSNITGNNYVGGIAGIGCGSYFTSQNNTITGNSYIGGIAGELLNGSQYLNNYEIETKHCNIYSTGGYAGGIAGKTIGNDLGKFKVKDSLIQGTTVNANYIGGISGSSAWSIVRSAVQDSIIQSLGSNVGGIAGELNGHVIGLNFAMDNVVEGYSNVGGICGNLKRGRINSNYHNNEVTATDHTAGGFVGYMENLGMTANTKTCQIYGNYIADSKVKAKSYVGGIIGDIQADLYTVQNYYYKNFIETELICEDESTMSLGIGGRPDQNVYFKDTYYYQYSKRNEKNPNEQNEIFIKREQYLNENDLKNRKTYSQKLIWGGEFDYTVLTQNKYPILSTNSNYYAAEQEGIDLPKDAERKEEIQVSETTLEEIENKEEILETANYKGNTIDTYSNFTVITAQNGKSVTRNDRIYVKEGKLYVLDGTLDMIENNVILDSYNGKEYETVLGTDGKLYDLKEALHYPENFKNENIVDLDNNLHTEYKITTVTYKDGSKIQFNYQTGEVLKEEKVQENQLGIMDYIKQSLETSNTLIEETKESYEESQNLLQELKEKPIEVAMQEKEGNIENMANTENTKNMQTSISSSNEKKYVTSYNPQTEKFDIYAEDELLNTKVKEVISENEKIEKNELEEYYTNDRIIRKGSGMIWISISIIGILITLGILWRRKNV